MTIVTNTARVSFNCDGVTKIFPVPIQAYLGSDFLVLLTNNATSVSATLALNSDYSMATASTDAPPKWSLRTLAATAFAAGNTLQVILNPQEVQQTRYVQGQQFQSSAIQANVDRLTQMVIRLQDQVSRALRAPDGDFNVGMLLPRAAQRAFTYQAYDGNGNAVCTIALPGTANTQASLGLALYPQSAAEANAGVVPANYAYAPGNILRYGTNAIPGTTDMTVAIQAAINQWAHGGAPVYVPTGLYFQASSLVLTATASGSNTAGASFVMYGDGMGASTITTSNDIENLSTAGANSGTFLLKSYIHDLAFINTFPATGNPIVGATHHHIHLQNPLQAVITRVYCKGAFNDAPVGIAGNHGGIWFDKQGFPQIFLNKVVDCWIDHAHVTMDTSDSSITNNIIWGMGTNYCIKANNSNITISNNFDFNGNGAHGGVWLTANAVLCKVIDNFFDTDCSFGVWGDQQINNIVANNVFWQTQNAAIWLVNPTFWSITGNEFLNCGQADTGVDNSDIVLNAIALATSNSVNGNVHFKTNARSGGAVYAVYERNGGLNPVGNYIVNEVINDSAGQYASPSIKLAGGGGSRMSIALNCHGRGAETVTAASGTGALGTFTPVFAGSSTAGSNTYSSQVGAYKVINNVCFFQINIQMTTKDAAMAGNVQIGGLPFPVGASASASATVGYKAAITTALNSLSTLSNPGTNFIRLGQFSAGTDWADLAVATLANASAINLTGFYSLD